MSKPDAGAAAFAFRCAVACLAAYALSLAFGLAQPLWAAMGATMVSQSELGKTRTSASARVVSTAFGALVSLAAGSFGARFGLPISARMGVAVALTAGVAHRFPEMRPAIWTCPLVLLSGEASQGLAEIAWRRASEVGFGALVGWLVHWSAEKLRPPN